MEMNAVVDLRAVHLDLKGVPPTFERLIDLLDIFKVGGYNAVLVEWEDMFSWTIDERFQSETAYSAKQIKKFHQVAKTKGFEIIPLIQCLGHLETFLKFDDYSCLREVENKTDCINPLADGAAELISKIIDDVLSLSGDIKYFHLGGDEAWTFGTHPDTKDFIEKYGKAELYIQHVQLFLDKLNSKGIRPILWHDMLIDWDAEALKKFSHKTDICIWGYGETPSETTSHYQMKYIEQFLKAGFCLWGGSAYKGADGCSRDVADPHSRRRNASSWVEVAGSNNFKGLIATGWSRYSTTRVQCEPIDANLDVLLYIGWILSYNYSPADYQEQAWEKLKKLGEFDRFYKCHQICRRFNTLRNTFWATVQDFYEQLALDKIQPQRNAMEVNMNTYEILTERFIRCREISLEFKDAFEGLISWVWIDEYLNSRLDAMELLISDMKHNIENSLAFC